MKTIFNLITLLLLFVSCGKDKTTEETPVKSDTIILSEQQWNNQNYQLVSPSVKDFSEVISASGVIDIPPKNKHVISVKTEGYINSINLLEGDFVKKGQLLFQLENPHFLDIQQSYLELHEQLGYLESEYNRYKSMYNEKIVAEKLFLKAQSDFKTAEAKHDGLKEQLTLLNISVNQLEKGIFSSIINIYAPINGYVSNLKVTKGMFINASHPALEILGNDHLHAELYVYEEDALKIKKGQEVIITPSASSYKRLKGEVHLVAKSLDENRRVKIHVHFKDSTDNLIAGMYVQGLINITQHQALTLPLNTVVEQNEKYVALKYLGKKNNTYILSKIALPVGNKNEDIIELLDTNNKSDQFLMNGAYYLIGD